MLTDALTTEQTHSADAQLRELTDGIQDVTLQEN